jgi:hypothetical protein
MSPEVIHKMMNHATFDVDLSHIRVSSNLSKVMITLEFKSSMFTGGTYSYPISGFPRIIMSEVNLKSMLFTLF